MRIVVLVFLVACADHGAGRAMSTCESSVSDGASCLVPQSCFKPNDFSGCASEICTCANGKYSCTAIAPQEGESCMGAPITSCSYEGNPSCDTSPTSQFCSCNADGTWHCTCACYGGFANTCSTGCPVRFADAENAMCAPPLDCTFPEGSCHCADGHFTCSHP